LKEEGHSILLVEQNASLALQLVDYVHVMSKGQVVYFRAFRKSFGPTTKSNPGTWESDGVIGEATGPSIAQETSQSLQGINRLRAAAGA